MPRAHSLALLQVNSVRDIKIRSAVSILDNINLKDFASLLVKDKNEVPVRETIVSELLKDKALMMRNSMISNRRMFYVLNPFEIALEKCYISNKALKFPEQFSNYLMLSTLIKKTQGPVILAERGPLIENISLVTLINLEDVVLLFRSPERLKFERILKWYKEVFLRSSMNNVHGLATSELVNYTLEDRRQNHNRKIFERSVFGSLN